MRRRLAALALLAFSLAVAGCGSGQDASGPDYRLMTPAEYAGAPPIATPTPGKEPAMTAADARRLRPVLAGWAAAVRRGDAARAARYFSLPAIVYQTSYGAVEVRTTAVARAFNGALPCGARLDSARADGRYIVGTFTLLNTAGGTCSTPDEHLRVGFVFGDPHHPRRFTEGWQGPDGPLRVGFVSGAPPPPRRFREWGRVRDDGGARPGPARRPLAVPATAAMFGGP